MRKRLLLGAVACSIGLGGVASAALNLGWADEFLGSAVWCQSPAGSGIHCSLGHMFTGLFTDSFPTWEFVGGQGANTQGRLNAREKVNFQFREVSSSSCISATVNNQRFRTTSPPTVGSSCTVASTSVGSVSQTFDSCVFPFADSYINNRMLPVFDFSLETGTGTIGYRSVHTVTLGSGGSVSQTGCFKISWF